MKKYGGRNKWWYDTEKVWLGYSVFVILQEKLEDILSKAPDWWGTSDKDIYDNLIFVMSPATAEIIAEKIGEPTKELEQICICDNTIFGLSTGINIVDLVNPEKLFFIGNRNFEFAGENICYLSHQAHFCCI